VTAKPGTVAELQAGIETKAQLLIELARRLSFPDYFGHNWDALWECICDLSWLPAGPVTIVHHDVPLTNGSADQRSYLGLLDDAVRQWRASGERDFAVLFPPEVEHHVAAVVKLAARDESPEPDWLPFTYRDFYDVPRMVVVPVGGNVVLLDCAFDETTDGHQDHYDVFLLSIDLESLRGGCADLGRLEELRRPGA
jgi:RNAse (barnase) inhibitor barstar